MVVFSVECELPLSPNDMWRIRSSAGFRRHVVEDGMLKRLDCSGDKTGPDGWTTRTQRYVPTKVDFPDFLRTVIGDAMFDVTDEQRFNDVEKPLCQHFRIRPTMFAALSTTSGTLTLHPVTDSVDGEDGGIPSLSKDGSDIDTGSSEGATDSVDSDGADSDSGTVNSDERSRVQSLPPQDRCVHVVNGDVKVNVPTVGWLVERSIVHNLRVFYKFYPGTVHRFRQKLYDQFAAGDTSVPCAVVIDRFLKYEEETESVSDGESSGEFETLKGCLDSSFPSGLNPPACVGNVDGSGLSNSLKSPVFPSAFPADLGAQLLPRGMDLGLNSKTIEEDFESFFVSA